MKSFTAAALLLLTPLITSAQSAPPPLVQNLNFTAAIDATAPVNLDSSSDNKLGIRSAEFMMYGAVDPTFDAVINFAAHNEDGEYKAELHEGYLSSYKLLPNFRFKVGTFFLGVGRLNQFHQHDWAFISAPKVQKEFFAEEGVHDTGAEFTYLLPTDSYWDVTMGVTNGYSWGESETQERPQMATHYIRPSTFIEFNDGSGLQIGINYLGRTDYQGLQTKLTGLDFVYKKKEGKINKWLFQSEIWYQEQNSASTDRSEKIGAYFYPEYGLTEQFFVGLRVDAFSDLSLKFDDGDQKKNLDYALVPTITYKNSEFSTWRLAYTHEVNNVALASDDVNRIIELQFIAILGAHPAHSF